MNIRRYFTSSLAKRLDERLNFLQVIVGPRQVGKSTGAAEIVAEWPGPKIMVSADSPAPPPPEWIASHWLRTRDLGPGTLLVFDEIHKVAGWAEAVKFLFDQDRAARNIKVVLLGSASLSLQTGLGESLAGRYELIKVDHWDWLENQKAFSWGLEQHLAFGGYPAPAELINDIPRWQSFMCDSIIEPVLTRDILGLARIHKPALFRQTLSLALKSPAQIVSYQKLLGQLQDQGNVTTIKHYLELFESAFLLKLIPKYSGGEFAAHRASPKILPLCPALCHAFVDPRRLQSDPDWRGRVFEAVIGARLSKSRGKLFYWQERHSELDYVLLLNDKLYAIEVKSGRSRNSFSMKAFLRQHPEAIPVTLDYADASQALLCDDIDQFISAGGNARS